MHPARPRANRSRRCPGGSPANAVSTAPTITPDGRVVAFDTDASNLAAGDSKLATDVLLHDLQVGAVRRASVPAGGGQGNGPSSLGGERLISDDGRFVAFQSDASNLVKGDTNGKRDVFLRDTATGQPVAAIYNTRALQSAPLSVPILVSDVSTPTEELIIGAPDPLPPGASWDAATRTLTWSDPAPSGTYKFTLTASDGVAKPVAFHYAIKVLPPDADPAKNTPPVPTRIKKLQALVGQPLSVPLLAIDRDGDPLVISADTSKPPFTAGATFDALTNTLSWTPAAADVGKVIAHFTVSDGQATVPLNVTIKVVVPVGL